MSLSSEKTKILLALINQGVSRFVVERDQLSLIVQSDESLELVTKAFNQKFSACVQFQKMADKVINSEAIDDVHSDHFNVIITLVNDEIDALEALTSTLIQTDKDAAVVANADIRKHIEVLREINRDLLGMFSYF